MSIVQHLRSAKTARDMKELVVEALADARSDESPPVDDYEHAISWLVQSLAAMEHTGNEFRLQRDGVREAYDVNLANNIELAKANKRLAYRMWRYQKKRADLNELEGMRRRVPRYLRSKKENDLLEKLRFYENYDQLVDIDLQANDEEIEKLMAMPVVEKMRVTRTPVDADGNPTGPAEPVV